LTIQLLNNCIGIVCFLLWNYKYLDASEKTGASTVVESVLKLVFVTVGVYVTFVFNGFDDVIKSNPT
jgi:hypothetical protein